MTSPGPDTQPIDATHCRRCGHPVIRALTDGLDITCDPHLLDLPTEIRAHLDNRPSYELLHYHDGHLEFIRRTHLRITWKPAAPVTAEHRCPPQQPLTWTQAVALPAPVRLTTRRPVSTPEDTCPLF